MKNPQPSTQESLVNAFGYLLGISYPVLALSTGVRAIYQLFFKAGVDNYTAPALSALAAACYLIATIGFLIKKPWAWRVSVWTLGIETTLTLVIGTLSLIIPDVIGSTVWRWYGADYGFFPLFQPLLGLVWLFWPGTLTAYGLGSLPQRFGLAWLGGLLGLLTGRRASP